MRRVGLIGATVVAACAVWGGTAGAALAKVTPRAQPATAWSSGGKGAPASPDVLSGAALPKGYVLRAAGPFDLPAGTQRRATVSCPGAKVPFGGGAYIATSALLGGINSSFPSGKQWVVDANNGAFSPTTFSVYVICARKPSGYKITKGPTVPAIVNDVSLIGAQCAAGRVALGGGSLVNTGSTAVNLAGSYPGQLAATGSGGGIQSSWNAWVANAGGPATTFTAYAVCAIAPRGYIAMQGSGSNPGLRQSSAQVQCVSPAAPIGGGSRPGTRTTAISINSTYPAGGGVWKSWQNNSGEAANTVTTVALCAGG